MTEGTGTHIDHALASAAEDLTQEFQGVFSPETVQRYVPEVLYVCVHNAGRSQIAAALTSRLSDGRVSVRSAGSTPASELNAAVVKAMAERGIDISHEFAKPLTDEVVRASDVVITMGCGDSCPVYPGKRYLDWVVEDPAGRSVDDVRPIVEDIERRVRGLLRELGIAEGAAR